MKLSEDYKIFKPRDKEVHCEHWCDCFKKAEWVVEILEENESYFQYFCKQHLDKFVKENKC